jgi:hypothetical protein
MSKQRSSWRSYAVAAIVAAFVSLPLMSVAQAQQSGASQTKYWKLSNAAARSGVKCKVFGAISHRCYTFDSDATWREGLSDYHGSN